MAYRRRRAGLAFRMLGLTNPLLALLLPSPFESDLPPSRFHVWTLCTSLVRPTAFLNPSVALNRTSDISSREGQKSPETAALRERVRNECEELIMNFFDRGGQVRLLGFRGTLV